MYGPYFFENPANSNNVRTLTTVAYIYLLETEFSGSNPAEVWFQQDGATSHTSSRAIDWLQSHFGNNIISNRSEFLVPPRSPDLSPLDYFLWEHVKEKVFNLNQVL